MSTFPASSSEVDAFLEDLISALPPPRGIDPDQLAANYRRAVDGFEGHTLRAFNTRLVKGEIDGITKWLPYPPELAQALRKLENELNRPVSYGRYRLPDPEVVPPFIRNREKKLAQYASWTLIEENVGIDRWMHMSKMGLPVGTIWVASLGRVYEPPAEGKGLGNAHDGANRG